MQLSIEMSLYPLADEYIPVIKEFIDRLNSHSELTVYTNTMSTQVFGDFDVLMTVFQAELKKTYEKIPSQCLVCKFINRDLAPTVGDHS